ncbi:MAG: hypothetical protein WCR54_05200, partial [Clostridia bacterium]
MTPKSKKIFKLVLLILCIVLMVALASCSNRVTQTEDEGTGIIGPGVDVTEIIAVDKNGAWNYIEKAVSNIDSTKYEDPEWLNIDFGITVDLNTYEKVGDEYTDAIKKTTNFSIVVKATINLKDNSQSILFFEMKDLYANIIKFGLYYYDSTLYINVFGNQFYTEQLNMTSLGIMLNELLIEKDIDIVPFVGNCLRGVIDIDNDMVSMVKLAWGLIFDTDNCLVEFSKDKELEYIYQYFKLDMVMDMITAGEIKIGTFLDVPISWVGFGLPNLDGLLQQLFGFSLASIQAKDWPSMPTKIYAIAQKGDVKQADGTTKPDYIFNGLGIDITADTGEFDFNFELTPFKLSTSNEKNVPMKLDGYDFVKGKNVIYKEGSFTNFELNGSLYVENKNPGEKVTIDQLLGGIVDLGAIGQMPIELKDESMYKFDLNLAVALDLFNNENNKVKLAISYNSEEILALYIVPDLAVNAGETVLKCSAYIDSHNMTSGGQQL